MSCTAAAKNKRRKRAKDLKFKLKYPNLECGRQCDKRESCLLLNQCIMTIDAVTGNRTLRKALKGQHSLKGVLGILEKHNPKPMRSYYPNLKKKK